MRAFHFRGEIPASKSILNRLLIIQSHAHSLEIKGRSNCDDVRDLRRAIAGLDDGGPVSAGSGGTTFRFLIARAARLPGRFSVTAAPRLLERPQAELVEVLAQLGVKLTLSSSGAVVEGNGWQRPDGAVRLSLARSSQFASAVLLNAWSLPFDLELQFEGEAISQSYFDLTLKIVAEAGMQVENLASGLRIRAGQSVRLTQLQADADMSSAFSIAALGALGGRVEILNFPLATAIAPQPDRAFVSILEKMGARCQLDGATLIVEKQKLHGVDVDLKNAPDLFPVLATLCAFAEGRSVLHGAPQLAFKESSRISNTAELLRKLGRSVAERADGLIIHGRAEESSAVFDFDPDHDHRIAMAAGLATLSGAKINVTDAHVVTKSYPDYWAILQAGLS